MTFLLLVYFICTSSLILPEVTKLPDPQVMQAHRQRVAQWERDSAGALQRYEEGVANAPVRRVWVPPQEARPPSSAPLKEGAQPDYGAPAREGYWREVRDTGMARPSAPPPRRASIRVE